MDMGQVLQSLKQLRRLEFRSQPLISVCVPVYNGEEFVRETLDAILAQDHGNVELLISVDRSSDASAKVCGLYAEAPRVQLFVQSTRLGWVGNMNFLIEQARGDYQCIIPHDDLIPPDYLNRLLNALRFRPRSVNAYPRIEAFGGEAGTISQRSVQGGRLARTLDVISNHYSAVSSVRGLVRRDLPLGVRRFDCGMPGDRCADTLLILQHALHGELTAVDTVVYRKRYHPGNEHSNWEKRPLTERIDTWAALSAAMCVHAVASLGPAHREELVDASVRRLFGRTPARAVLMDHEFQMQNVANELTARFARYLQCGRFGAPAI